MQSVNWVLQDDRRQDASYDAVQLLDECYDAVQRSCTIQDGSAWESQEEETAVKEGHHDYINLITIERDGLTWIRVASQSGDTEGQ